MGYDASKLKTPNECRIVMRRAQERELPDVYNTAFKRLCELTGAANDDPSDPLIADFYKTLAAYEQLLSEKNERNTIASRTRQKITNKGVHQSLIEWTRGKTETNGFKLLVEKGLPEYTGEFLVVLYAHRFPQDVVSLAKSRLTEHGIALPASH
ncbi:hypothetical protein [Pseudorhodoplanes sp.]|uniref:hypothetical protein n=1 Tax=Pseudorhodoplanes sp. TaxID=1934341 RepID=UPI0039199971